MTRLIDETVTPSAEDDETATATRERQPPPKAYHGLPSNCQVELSGVEPLTS